MIKYVDNGEETQFLLRYASSGYFSAKAEVCLALRDISKNDGFWMNEHCALLKTDSCIDLVFDEECDVSELASFIITIGADTVTGPKDCILRIFDLIGARSHKTGLIMKCSNLKYDPQYRIEICNEPGLRDILELVSEVSDSDCSPLDYESAYWWTSLKNRRGYSFSEAVYRNDVCVSSASAVWIGKESAVIGSVATKEPYRKNGYASALVSDITSKLQKAKKEVYLSCCMHDADNLSYEYKAEAAYRIYKKLGFADFGEISILSL